MPIKLWLFIKHKGTPQLQKVKSKSVSQHTTKENHQTIEEEIKRRRNEQRTIKTNEDNKMPKVRLIYTRGRVWGGRREEGSGWGARVYLW